MKKNILNEYLAASIKEIKAEAASLEDAKDADWETLDQLFLSTML